MHAPQQEKKHRIVKTLGLVLLVFVLMFAAFQAGRFVQDMIHAAKTSRRNTEQAVVLVEILQHLGSVPTGSEYPRSLEELPLTYPDGGNASLLPLFLYESGGAHCTLRTYLHDEWRIESFPRKESP